MLPESSHDLRNIKPMLPKNLLILSFFMLPPLPCVCFLSEKVVCGTAKLRNVRIVFLYFSDFTIYQIFVNINIHISLPLTAVFFDYGCFYKMSGGMSRDSMIKALEKEGFTHEQAVHAADVLKR